VCATILVFVDYLAAARLVPAPRALSVAAGVALGAAGFALGTALLGRLPLTRGAIMPLAAVVCAATGWMVRGLPHTATLRRAPASPLILATRAGASAVAVVTVTGLAHLLGPKWSGLVAGFPVNGLPVMAILHYQYGVRVIEPFVRIFPAGAFGICLFNLVAYLALVPLGLGPAVALAYLVDITYLAAVSQLTRSRRP